MRPIDSCTPKRSKPSTRASSLPGAAAPRGSPLSSRGFRLVLVRANVCFARRSTRPETAGSGHREARGRSMRTRPGGFAIHGATPTSATGLPGVLGVVFRARDRPTASGTSVASSSPRRGPEGFSARRLEGRQDRFRGGLVKGARFPGRRCLPSPAAARAALAPKCERATLPSPIARRSRDEDRRAPTNRPRFAPRAADARASVVLPRRARLPFTRSVRRSGFRPARRR
jgi:hypothetical protein